MNKKFLFLIPVVLLVGGVIFLIMKGPVNRVPDVDSNSTHAITLTKDGFIPKEITIHQGDTVVFSSQLSRQFWPASDLHPTHGIYPEFDPKHPIEPTQSWSFVFSRAGSFKFHDHLDFTQRGIINVLAAGQSDVQALNCSENSNDPQCWDEEINKALKNESLDEAFNVVAMLYETQPAFALQCHGYAHKLGEKAFELFFQNKDVQLSSKTAYCGYGFYHGFMENLLKVTGDVQKAKDFCAYAGKKLSGQTTDAEGACYHGIGHGAVDGSDPTAWGDAEKMMAPGMKLCEAVAGDDRSEFGKLYRCVSGAFNAIEILSSDPKYKLEEIAKDPFYLCPNQPENFWEACYTNMLPTVLKFTNNNFAKSAKMVEQIKAPLNVRSQVMLSLFHEWIRENLNKSDYGVTDALKICRNLNSDMRLPCVQGLSGGHMKYGQPQKEYEKGLAFCASSQLKKDEQEVCFNYILPRLRIWYSAEKSQEICQSQPAEYQSLCLVRLNFLFKNVGSLKF